MKTLGAAAGQSMCTTLQRAFACKLAKGAHRFTVKAIDKVGDKATKLETSGLTVT